MLYDARAKGAEADTHWHRLFTTDQYTERGMIDANYFDMCEPRRPFRWNQHVQSEVSNRRAD
eukprot:3324127-Pleurochrysis_carterae.AAC.4